MRIEEVKNDLCRIESSVLKTKLNPLGSGNQIALLEVGNQIQMEEKLTVCDKQVYTTNISGALIYMLGEGDKLLQVSKRFNPDHKNLQIMSAIAYTAYETNLR